MNPMTTSICAAALLLATTCRYSEAADEPTVPATQPTTHLAASDDASNRPQVEVCFVLDTTGSMGGLIEGAKQKVWAIANTIIAEKDRPRLKIALLAYRDKGDAYVTRTFDLTDDIDTVFKNLREFKADGGGDTPESVNQALNEAITKISWSDKKQVTKLIFLVGDAPPHMDYQDDVKYPESCKLAGKKDIVINTVQCGTMAETTPIWQDMAKLSHGTYIAVPQEGGVIAMATPFDKELTDLNARCAMTAVAYGEMAQQHEVAAKVAANLAPTTSPAVGASSLFGARADRAAYNAKDGGKAIQGKGDLVWDCANGVVSLDQLKTSDLPSELQKLTPDQRKDYIEQKQKQRDDLQGKITDLSKKREAYLTTKRAELSKTQPADAFDLKVEAVIREQVEAKK